MSSESFFLRDLFPVWTVGTENVWEGTFVAVIGSDSADDFKFWESAVHAAIIACLGLAGGICDSSVVEDTGEGQW